MVAAGVTLTVRTLPSVDRLYFWALQVTFESRFGGARGTAHLGMMWNPRHPDSNAANWGGYAPGGTVLGGPAAGLPSATANPNTFDYRWEPGRPYRLSIERGADGWLGTITDAGGRATLLRTLGAGGRRLSGIGVWSEVFADCDHPTAGVEWSEPWQRSEDGLVVRPDRCRLTYQDEGRGGCTNTSTTVAGTALVQRTNVERPNGDGDTIAWPG